MKVIKIFLFILLALLCSCDLGDRIAECIDDFFGDEETEPTGDTTNPPPTPLSTPIPTPTPVPTDLFIWEEFWNEKYSEWTSPIENCNYSLTPTGAFGADRNNGTRTHAGIDLHVDEGTSIHAIADGTVIRISEDFYYGTQAVEVRGSDNVVIRYCEISVSVEVGSTVNQNDIIGTAIPNTDNNQVMLHLEMYLGTVEGSLSQPENTTYLYVKEKQYQRRPDLIDPSTITSFCE